MIQTSLRLLITSVLVWAGVQASAQGPPNEYETLKSEVQLRAETIQELKRQGAFKEGAGGLLIEASSDISQPQRHLLDEENTARQRLFELIAMRLQKSPGEVAGMFQAMATKSASQPREAAPATMPKPDPKQDTPHVMPMKSAEPSATGNPTSNTPLPNPRTKAVPMKVLSRPLAAIYAEPSPNAFKIKENTPAFNAYYVYQKQEGWYEVGSDNKGKKLGWMKADDVMEWKQNLVVAFSHPEGRKPVLMFRDQQPLLNIVQADRSARSSGAAQLYDTIEHGQIPSNFPVQTIEPKRASQSQFYVLPILNYVSTEMDGREGRVLQLAAGSRKRGSSDLQDPKEREQLNRATDFTGKAAQGAQVDVVFVMDLTRSMGPFAEATLSMIKQIVHELRSDSQVTQSMRFGFWGYRDFPEMCKGIEFNTYNFTPELMPISEFPGRLGEVRETKIDSVDYEEDVFAGVTDAIEKTNWRPGSVKQVILVGDAPGRSPGICGKGFPDGPKGTKSGLDAEGVRALADSRNVYITSLYLKADRWKEYAEAGGRQFGILARNPNARGSENVRVLAADDTRIYAATAEALSHGIIDFLHNIQSGIVPPSYTVDAPPLSTSSSSDVKTEAAGREAGAELARNMFRGALVEWLGAKDAATVPRDVTVWASDKDLLNSKVQSLEVQVYLTKNELNNLKLVADSVVNAGVRGKISGEDLFHALQAVVASAAADPEQIKNAETLGKTGIVPEFLRDLPYQSSLMQMTNETWTRMSPDAQDQFINTVLAKLQYYQKVHDNADRWQSLNEGDDRDNWVAGIPLDQLP